MTFPLGYQQVSLALNSDSKAGGINLSGDFPVSYVIGTDRYQLWVRWRRHGRDEGSQRGDIRLAAFETSPKIERAKLILISSHHPVTPADSDEVDDGRSRTQDRFDGRFGRYKRACVNAISTSGGVDARGSVGRRLDQGLPRHLGLYQLRR